MSFQFSKGLFKLKHPEKYVGNRSPIYRSSWEFSVMTMCDNNPAIEQWSSEPVKIPYRDPLTGKNTVYVPDFLVVYVDKNLKKHAELWEVKPAKQTFKEQVGKNPYDQAQFIKNQVKWEAASRWAKNHNVHFRIITENEIYVGIKKRNK